MRPSEKHRKKPQEQYTRFAVRVERYEASVGASVNRNAYAPQYGWDLDDDDPVYEFSNHLMIAGVSTFPPERAGDQYELTIYGTDARSHRLNATLKDIQARDKHGSPQYRSYRGKQIPVYLPPTGFGLIDKVRGERRWTAWLFVRRRFVTDMLVLLGHKRELFVSLEERKIERARWVQALSLQTVDPAEE